MKLALIVNKFPPLIDGVGDYTYRLVQELSTRGWDIHIICHSQVPQGEQGSSYTLYPVVEAWNRKGVRQVLSMVQEIQPDWVLLQYVPYSFQVWGIPVALLGLWLQLRWRGFRLAVFFHEIKTKVPRWWSRHGLVSLLMGWVANGLHLLSHRTMTSNERYRAFFGWRQQAVAIIRIGSNIPARPISDEELMTRRQALGISPTARMIGFFGSRIRGGQVILQALQELESQGLEVQLLIVGRLSEEDRQAVFQQAQDLKLRHSPVLTGAVPSEEVAAYLHLLECYLMLQPTDSPLHWTGTGTKSGSLAAGLMMGLPVIGTAGEMNDSFFAETQSVCLLPRLKVNELTAAIKTILLEDEQAVQWQKRSRQAYQQLLSWPVIADQYQQVLS